MYTLLALFCIIMATLNAAELKSVSNSFDSDKYLNDCSEWFECGSGSSIQQWNPMEMDFLASNNNYAYDEEDASIAIQGYSEYIVNAAV